MKKLVGVCMCQALFAQPLFAKDVTEAAKDVAKELADAWRPRTSGARSVFVDAFEGGSQAQGFAAAVLDELRRLGFQALDRKAVEATLSEAALADLGAKALAEAAGALGAGALLTGRIDKAAGEYRGQVRLVRIETGELIATSSVRIDDPEESVDELAPLHGRALEVQIRRLADRLVLGLGKLGEPRYQQYAVLPFDEIGVTTKDKQLGLLVASELTTFLHRDHGLYLVERGALSKVLDELALGQTGLVDPAKAAEVGKLSGARGLIIGSVSEAGDRYRVNARIVDVRDASVIGAEDIALPAADLVALSSEAVVLRTRSGAIYRAILLPGWGQFYNREPVKGSLFAAGEAAAGLLALLFHFKGVAADKDYRNLNNESDPALFDRYDQDRTTQWTRRNTAIYALIGIHLLNIIDAAVFGKSFDSASPAAN